MKKTILYAAFTVYRDIPDKWELLGVFDDPELIKAAYAGKDTAEFAIGYGEVEVNEALPVDVMVPWGDKWHWLD